jgi:hypothetical protein
MLKLSEQRRIHKEVTDYVKSLPEYCEPTTHYNLATLKSLVNDIEFYLSVDEVKRGNPVFSCHGMFNKHIEGSGLTKPYNHKYNFYFDDNLNIDDFIEYLDYVLDVLRDDKKKG